MKIYLEAECWKTFFCPLLNHDQKQNTLSVCKDFQDQNKSGANFISKGLLFPEFKFELK